MRLLIGVIAALAVGLVAAPVAQAHPCSPEPVCHEFDYFIPYYDSFEQNGAGYLIAEVGVPLANQAARICNGEPWSREEIRDIQILWEGTPKEWGRRLTEAEVDKVIEVAYDVCPPGPLVRAQ